MPFVLYSASSFSICAISFLCSQQGRKGCARRWELCPSATTPPLRVHVIKMHQQFETPPAVVATLRRLWQPTFDAMATPFSAVCASYATLEDDVMSPNLIPPNSIIYVNPAYATGEQKNRNQGIEVHLQKLIEIDVQDRGSTLIALLPNLSHTTWHQKFVAKSHEIHNIMGTLVFPNPFTDVGQRQKEKSYLWEVRSYILCVWRPLPPPLQPKTAYLKLDDVQGSNIQLRSCLKCHRVRLLPRWVDASMPSLQSGSFVCEANPDCKYNSCSVPEFLLHPAV